MKKFISLIVVLCILLCTLTVAANEPPHSDVTWNFENGILTIKGAGAMENYKTESDAPWYEYRSEITKIVVEEGITHIGNMAFYGLKNATEAYVAKSVESIGLCAFDYTEGTITSLGNISADFQFTLESDAQVVSEGDSFTLTIKLNGDFKDVAAVQSALVFDKNKISISEDKWYDEAWYSSIGDDNLGYISKPASGFVANNLRIAYISLGGDTINEGSPLYTKGKTDVIVAKVVCTALCDIKDINTSLFMLKNSGVSLVTDGRIVNSTCGENQLTTCTKMPVQGLKIKTESSAMEEYAKANSISCEKTVSAEIETESAPEIKVLVNGNEIDLYTTPFENENGSVMIPLRAVMENMGVAVIWDGETKTIFMATDADFAATQLGKKTVFRNENAIELNEASIAKDGRTLVSMDFFEKSFGFTTLWDEAQKTATIK